MSTSLAALTTLLSDDAARQSETYTTEILFKSLTNRCLQRTVPHMLQISSGSLLMPI